MIVAGGNPEANISVVMRFKSKLPCYGSEAKTTTAITPVLGSAPDFFFCGALPFSLQTKSTIKHKYITYLENFKR